MMKQYIYKDKIGSGNYSTVYKANNILTHETVAIKKINKSKFPSVLINRFSKEIEILKLINHTNTIKLKDYFIDDKYIYIITEYCNSGSLKEQIGIIKDEIDVRHIVKQIINGIQYLDDVGIMHRDIKPDNILLNDDNVIKIIDFGFSVQIKDSDLYSTICGTPLYMSPELLQSKEYSKSSDLWSIGIISYELFHYIHPFGAPKNILELLENIKHNKILYKSNISYHFLQFIDSLLQLEPSSRPQLASLNLHPWFNTILSRYDLNYNDDLFHMDDFHVHTDNKLITKEAYENNNTDIEEFENIEMTQSIIDELPKTQPINIITNNDKHKSPYEKLQTVDYMSPISPRFISNKIINYSTRVIKNITGYTY